MDPLVIVSLVVGLALFFDFTNGFHDTANSSATAIATGALKPRTAVLIAAIMNFAGAFLSTAVAKAISVSLISAGVEIGPEMIFAGLTGAILWNLTTWLLGLPSSSSHALFGGLIGAALVYEGFGAINYPALLDKLFLPAVFAPLIAGLAALLATRLAYIITSRRHDEAGSAAIASGRTTFKVGQVFTSSLVALSHGTNDAQKTMGVITLVLVAAGLQSSGDHVEPWVIVAAATAMAVGTYAGGWRIIRTMGAGLSEIKPPQGLGAELSTAATILASSNLGFALSTTQVASGGVMGAGLGRQGGRVRWTKAGQVVTGWLLTLPAAAAVGALSSLLVLSSPIGLLADAILVVAVSISIFQISRRNRITQTNVVSELEEASEVIASPRAVRREAAKAAKFALEAKRASDLAKVSPSGRGAKND